MTHAVALGLFAKWPEVGRVKTRLARESSPEFAADIARTFLLETLERLRELAGCDQYLAYDPPDAQSRQDDRGRPGAAPEVEDTPRGPIARTTSNGRPPSTSRRQLAAYWRTDQVP